MIHHLGFWWSIWLQVPMYSLNFTILILGGWRVSLNGMASKKAKGDGLAQKLFWVGGNLWSWGQDQLVYDFKHTFIHCCFQNQRRHGALECYKACWRWQSSSLVEAAILFFNFLGSLFSPGSDWRILCKNKVSMIAGFYW